MSMTDMTRTLAASIVDFLQDAIDDGIVAGDDERSIRIASQYLRDVFDTDSAHSLPVALKWIFKTYEHVYAANDRTNAIAKMPKATFDKAEALKAEGNAAMSAKKYTEAVEKYTAAIALNPDNKAYYCNRAAAYSSCNEHDLAIPDAIQAIKMDWQYVKAWLRLGYAYFSAGMLEIAKKAYARGLELNPSNPILRKRLEMVTNKMAEQNSTRARDPEEDSSCFRDYIAQFKEMYRDTDLLERIMALTRKFPTQTGRGLGAFDERCMNPAYCEEVMKIVGSGVINQLFNSPPLRKLREARRTNERVSTAYIIEKEN